MSSLSGYKSIVDILTPYPTESGGRALNDNFVNIADLLSVINNISGIPIVGQPIYGNVLAYDGINWVPSGVVSSSSGTTTTSIRSIPFFPSDAEMPLSNYASYDSIGGNYAIKFLANRYEQVGFSNTVPVDFTNILNGKVSVNYYLAETGIFSGGVNWQVYFDGFSDHSSTSGDTTSFTTNYNGQDGYLHTGSGIVDSGLHVLQPEYHFKMNLGCSSTRDVYLLSTILKFF
jgi:hypothetical protein